MSLRLLVFFFIFCSCLNAKANDFALELNRIDSLIWYNDFLWAEKRVDSNLIVLEKNISNRKSNESYLELLFRKALIIDDKFDHRLALPIFMEVLASAQKKKFNRLTCKTMIRIAFNQEKANNYDVAYTYLNEANRLCREHSFDSLYSAILVRYALLHRFFGDDKSIVTKEQRQKLSELGFKGSLDSAVYYVESAIKYAEKYKNEYDLNEAYLTMGILFGKSRKNSVSKSISYFNKTIPFWLKTHNYEYVAMMYHNIARNYIDLNDAKTALTHNDSAYLYYDKMSVYYKYTIPDQRSKILFELDQPDSAYHYLRIACNEIEERSARQETSNTKRLEEQYQNDKKVAEIEAKNRQMILIGSLLGVITLATILLVRKNREINKKNITISNQLIELTKILEQKQVLLSELQHRVKNNLQHVISILEIQKESVDFNNIDELIRGNQNRIHSMALLHKKLNVNETVTDADLPRYVTELSELVKDSYSNNKQKIKLAITCAIDTLSIEKALPLGLIIVELVSNSMKHAFEKRSIGIINIEIAKNEKQNKLYYADNGVGYDFKKTTEKGLGQEIIKGLIDQLGGTYTSQDRNGFELIIYFK